MTKSITGIITGLLLGYLSSKLLFLQGKTLIFWGIAALILGYFSKERSESLTVGTLYGFFLGFSFMVFNYNGSASLISRLPFFALLGVVSAIAAVVISFLGYVIKSRFQRG